MPKLRHVSLHTADPEKTAELYKRVFDMVEVGRTDSKFAEGIFLSDGTINLSVVRFKTKEAADGATASVRRSVCTTLAFGWKTRTRGTKWGQATFRFARSKNPPVPFFNSFFNSSTRRRLRHPNRPGIIRA